MVCADFREQWFRELPRDVFFLESGVQRSDLFFPKRTPWKSKTKQRMVFRMIHVKDSLLPRGKVWSLDFLGDLLLNWPFLLSSLLLFIFRFMVPGSGLPCNRWKSLFDLILGMHVSPIVDGRNPKQPPGMYKTLYKDVTKQPPGMYNPCKKWDKLPTSAG